MARSLTLATLVALAGGSASLAAQAPPPPAWANFTRTFDAYATADSIVGASVLVAAGFEAALMHLLGLAIIPPFFYDTPIGIVNMAFKVLFHDLVLCVQCQGSC